MRQRKDPTRKAAKNLGNVKIEATASDGAENASDHFVTSFLVLGHRKGGVFVETPPQSVKKVEVQEALLPLNRRRDYCRSPRSFRVTPAGR